MTTVEYKNNNVVIAGVEIDNSLFDEEKVGYKLVDRKNEIDELYRMISECGYERESNKFLMIEAQDFLKSVDDEFVFSSIRCNEFIAESRNTKYFNTICSDILIANGTPKAEVKKLVSFEKQRGVFKQYFMGADLIMEIDPTILSGIENDHYNDTLTQAIMDGDDSGEISFDGFTYWWKKDECETALNTVYEVTQHETHGERLCSFGMFTDRENALEEAVRGFSSLYTNFEESIFECGTNQWIYEGFDRATGRDTDFMFCITEIALDKFGEL